MTPAGCRWESSIRRILMHCHKPHPMQALSFPASELAPATLEFHTAICVTNVPITAKPTQSPSIPSARLCTSISPCQPGFLRTKSEILGADSNSLFPTWRNQRQHGAESCWMDWTFLGQWTKDWVIKRLKSGTNSTECSERKIPGLVPAPGWGPKKPTNNKKTQQ